MYPVLLQIGSFQLRTYGACAALGFLCACFLLNRFRTAGNLSSDQATGTLFTALVAGIAGARIFYVVQFWGQFADAPWKVIRIDQGGLVFYGGFLLAIAALWIYCKVQKIDFIRLLDVYAPVMAAAHAFGRIGCFFNGCCYGRPTDCSLGVVYPHGSFPDTMLPNQALHPVQLYEAGEQLALFWLYVYLLRKKPRGVTFSCYLMIYGILRFINEFFRGDNPKLLHFTPAQWIGVALIPAGLLSMIYFLRHDRKTA